MLVQSALRAIVDEFFFNNMLPTIAARLQSIVDTKCISARCFARIDEIVPGSDIASAMMKSNFLQLLKDIRIQYNDIAFDDTTRTKKLQHKIMSFLPRKLSDLTTHYLEPFCSNIWPTGELVAEKSSHRATTFFFASTREINWYSIVEKVCKFENLGSVTSDAHRMRLFLRSKIASSIGQETVNKIKQFVNPGMSSLPSQNVLSRDVRSAMDKTWDLIQSLPGESILNSVQCALEEELDTPLIQSLFSQAAEAADLTHAKLISIALQIHRQTSNKSFLSKLKNTTDVATFALLDDINFV